MKAHLGAIVGAERPDRQALVAREYIQTRALTFLQTQGAFGPLAFHGGTALRFLFGLDRFSEDLDFALERPGTAYDPRSYRDAFVNRFSAETYDVEVTLSEARTVHELWLRFPGLEAELGIPAPPGKQLSIKIEVDTRPPPGAGLSVSTVRRYGSIVRLQHHDRYVVTPLDARRGQIRRYWPARFTRCLVDPSQRGATCTTSCGISRTLHGRPQHPYADRGSSPDRLEGVRPHRVELARRGTRAAWCDPVGRSMAGGSTVSGVAVAQRGRGPVRGI